MSYIFETVTGSTGELAFKFNGQFALKNYNVEIVNGNRLKVVSASNEMFSLLEAEISEVEINGMIYTDPTAAQIALTSLVYSSAEPVVLTKEKYMQLAAAVQAADRGKISPTTPVPSGGWLKGWYKPDTSSADPGTNYPYAGNMKAVKGFINRFYYDGVAWFPVREEIGGNVASSIFDKNDNINPSTMKAAAERYDKLLTAANYFTTEGEKQPIALGNTTHGYIKKDGTLGSTDQYAWYQKVNVQGFNRILYNGYKSVVSASGISTYSSLLIEKSDGTFTSLIDPGDVASGNKLVNSYFDLPSNAVYAHICWSNYQSAAGSIPTVRIDKAPYLETDNIKTYMDNYFSVLDSFILPTEIVWEEITMPQAGENDNKAMGINFNVIDGAGFAYGLIPVATLTGYDYIKMVGDLDKFGGIWLWGQNTPAGVLEKLLTGVNTGEKIIPTNNAKYLNYGYTRYKTGTKIYRGKIVKKPLVKDSVKKFILENSGGSNAGTINAYSEFGVKASNSAAENTTKFNAAISAAHDQKKVLILPSGVLLHEGINYIQDVIIKGAGMRLTTLKSTTAVTALKSADRADDPYFSLAVGSISDMTIEGNNIGTVGVDVQNIANSNYSNLLIKGFTEWCMKAAGLLIFEFDNVYFQSSKRGLSLTKSTNSGYGLMQANLIAFNRCNFIGLTTLGIELSYGANYAFNNCSIGATGTVGDDTTGFMYAHDLSPTVAGGSEGVDVTMNQCWFEVLNGGFGIKLENAKGVTTIRDTMLWTLSGDCKKAIINNGSRVLITGSTKVTTAKTSDIETTNNGQTRIDGFSVVGTHVESTGGTYKTATYQ